MTVSFVANGQYLGSHDPPTLPMPEMDYRRLFETAKDGILMLDASTGRILDVNPFMERLLDRSHAEFSGKELWQIGRPVDIDANQAAFRALQENGYIRYDHLPLETKKGHAVDVEFVSNTYVAGGLDVAQCNIRDITEQRRLERRLRDQLKTSEDLNHRKDEVLAMLGHELRSPLSAIINSVHLLRDGARDTAVCGKAAAIVDRQVKQLARIIEDLLESSRVTTGHIHLRRDDVDLRSIVENAVETVQPLVERHKHDLRLSMPHEPVRLHVDASRIERVLINLLTNAAKYTPDAGHISVIVETQRDQVVVRVQDTGIGITHEMMPSVFDLFTQANGSLDLSEGGLGIGLTLAQRLVTLHGGTLAASSPGLGQGCEFVVRLPRDFHASPHPNP